MAADSRLPVLPIPGLSPDSLGNYLASLGLLHVLSRRWPSTRIAWRGEILQIVGGPRTFDELLDELMRVATQRAWTRYNKAWSDAQKKGTKAESGEPLALWQAQADEADLALFAAHAVPRARAIFNPLFGSGGNAGRRDFAAGWKQAVDALATVRTTSSTKSGARTNKRAVAAGDASSGTDQRRTELRAVLCGQPVIWLLDKLGAGSWFSNATKVYNSGQAPSRKGQASPWSMVLACEGLALLAGGASRRLGVRSRAVGAFPFVTQPAAPVVAGEAGRILGEFWAPLWQRPMTLAEAGTLFLRGRAELHGRGALSPATFATAIQERGVDAGIEEFRRFTLGRTTSDNTFEPCFEARLPLHRSGSGRSATSIALARASALIEQRGFPRDRKKRDRWRFEGVRGPIEAALLDVAADPQRSEAAIALLDAIVAALDRIDRNRAFREGGVRWEPLPTEWLSLLFSAKPPAVEARLALSIVSGFPAALPFTAYRFGVEWIADGSYSWTTQPAWFEHSKVAPPRWVWGPGELGRVLGALLSRRLLDEAALDANGTLRPVGRAPLPATTSQIRQWLENDLDDRLFRAWLSRLALLDWRKVPEEVRSFLASDGLVRRVDGEVALVGLIQPLVDRRPLIVRDLSRDDLLSDKTGARTTEAARSLVTLIRSGSLDAAVRLASSRYGMAHARLASFDVPWAVRDRERFAAALLFTISNRERAVLLERWLRPRRRQTGGEAHV